MRALSANITPPFLRRPRSLLDRPDYTDQQWVGGSSVRRSACDPRPKYRQCNNSAALWGCGRHAEIVDIMPAHDPTGVGTCLAASMRSTLHLMYWILGRATWRTSTAPIWRLRWCCF